jgi:AcrR family transcriptional regulator
MASDVQTRMMSDPEETRARLLEAAAEVFAEVGYHAATIRQICAKANANVALVNYHFGDKSELYEAVLNSLLRDSAVMEVQDRLSRPGRTPEETLREIIYLRLRGILHHERHSWHLRLLCHEMANPSPAAHNVHKLFLLPIAARASVLVGSILGLPPEHPKTRLCIFSIAGQVIFHVLSSTALGKLAGRPPITEEECEILADHISEFSLAYLHQQGHSNQGE